MFNLFKKAKTPQIGEIWVSHYTALDPWDETPDLKVKVLDIKDGWAKYVYLTPHGEEDDREHKTPIKSFISYFVYP